MELLSLGQIRSNDPQLFMYVEKNLVRRNTDTNLSG